MVPLHIQGMGLLKQSSTNVHNRLALLLGVGFGFLLAVPDDAGPNRDRKNEAHAALENSRTNKVERQLSPKSAGGIVSATLRGEQRAEQDLRAQRQMSTWAFLTMLFTGLGVGLIYRTLQETKSALIEAKRAADAAETSTSITREIGMAQVRGYFSLLKAEMLWDADRYRFGIVITINNSGQSPGRHVGGEAVCHAMFVNTDLKPNEEYFGDDVEEQLYPTGMTQAIPSGESVKFYLRSPDDRIAHALLDPGAIEPDYSISDIYVSGIVYVTDVFGDQTKLPFRARKNVFPGFPTGMSDLNLSTASTHEDEDDLGLFDEDIDYPLPS